MVEYIKQEDYLRQKRSLAKALKTADPVERRVAVEADVIATLTEWADKAWPDDWSAWQRALDDVRHWRDQISLDDFMANHRAALRAERDERAARAKAENDAKYPEHTKLEALDGANQTIGQFIEWLGEKGYALCEWADDGIATIDGDSNVVNGGFVVLNRPASSWIAEYFQINPVALEQEKRTMLEEMRAMQGLDSEGVKR